MAFPVKEIEAAAQVAKAEGLRALGVSGGTAPIVRADPQALPFVFTTEYSDGWRQQVLVVDGHVVTERSMKTMGSYFRKIGLLERRDWGIDIIAGFFDLWGERPPGFTYIVTTTNGPHTDDVARLIWSDKALDLVVYSTWMPPSGGKRAFDTYLRATMHIDRSYRLEWKVEKFDTLPGKSWEPFTGR